MSVLVAWLAKEGAGLLLGALAKILLDLWSDHQANQALRKSAVAETVATINKETADAERRANEVAVNRPDVSTVVAGMERGDAF
jgi:hypothetical protein